MADAMIIDLTLDDEGSEVNGAANQTHSRSSSPGYVPAIDIEKNKKEAKASTKEFSSYEIKSLSTSRVAHTRLPDILQQDQKKQIVNASHSGIFVGWIQEHEESSAPLTLTNEVDGYIQPIPPTDWMYTDGYVLDEQLQKSSRRIGSTSIIVPRGCDCDTDSGMCDPKKCSCYALHEKLAPDPWVEQTRSDGVDQPDYKVPSDIRGNFAYRDGRLRSDLVLWPQTPIWECNSNCACTGDCRNRVVQKGRTVALDIFKSPTPYKGWGIRAKQRIKAGTFITVYAGELLSWDTSETRAELYETASTTYILDIDSHHIRRKLWVEPYIEELQKQGIQRDELDEDIEAEAMAWAVKHPGDSMMTYSIDAGLWGNLARYFNHSCNPNMNLYPVYTEERDLRRPFLAFFANKEIYEGEELTFAYGGGQDDPSTAQVQAKKFVVAEEMQEQNPGAEVTIKTDGKYNLTSMKCSCGSYNCRGTVFLRGS